MDLPCVNRMPVLGYTPDIKLGRPHGGFVRVVSVRASRSERLRCPDCHQMGMCFTSLQRGIYVSTTDLSHKNSYVK